MHELNVIDFGFNIDRKNKFISVIRQRIKQMKSETGDWCMHHRMKFCIILHWMQHEPLD